MVSRASPTKVILVAYCMVAMILLGVHSYLHTVTNPPIESILYHLLPSVVVFCVYRIFRQRHNSTAEMLDQAAEQIYFLGYIATLSGLIILAIRLYLRKSMLDSPESLLGEGGATILSSIVGVALMQLMRSYANEMRRIDEANKDIILEGLLTKLDQSIEGLNRSVSGLQTNLAPEIARGINAEWEKLEADRTERLDAAFLTTGAGKALSTLVSGLKDAAPAIAGLGRASHTLNEAAGKLSADAQSLAIHLGTVNTITEGLQNKWVIIGGVIENLGGTSQSLAMFTDGLEGVGITAQGFTQSLSSAHEKINGLNVSFDETARSLSSGTRELASFHNQVREFTVMVEKVVQPLRAAADTFHDVKDLQIRLEDLKNKFGVLADVIMASAECIGKFGSSQGELAQTLDFVTQQLKEQIHTLKGLSGLVPSLSELTTDISNALVPLRETGTNLNALNTHLKDIHEISGKSEALIKSFSDLAKATDGFRENTSATSENIAKVDQEVMNLHKVLGEYVKFIDLTTNLRQREQTSTRART